MITQERLHELLDYNPDTGVFIWMVDFNHIKAGSIAGYVHRERNKEYRTIRIAGKDYKAHRLAWIFVHGCWPKKQIDHINGDKGDNRLVNLREASNGQNKANSGLSKANTSGYKGVSRQSYRRGWRAQIKKNGKSRYIGGYDTPEEAHAAYCIEAEKLHGQFARTA